jgi:hypothetical protein
MIVVASAGEGIEVGWPPNDGNVLSPVNKDGPRIDKSGDPVKQIDVGLGKRLAQLGADIREHW